MITRHPSETDLALLAGGDCGSFARFTLNRHLRDCGECQMKLADFAVLREETAHLPEPSLNWDSLAAEMRANIHLGIEAGECIRSVQQARNWNPRLMVAFACLMLVIAASIVMRRPVAIVQTATVLESTGSGLEVRSKSGSLTLLNHHGAVADQTVSAQGAIRARYIDGEAGTVTINNVYLE